MYDKYTEATSPTDYNRFYNYAFDVYYVGGSPSTGCPQSGVWRQGFWQCQGLACAGSGGGGGCGPCPVSQRFGKRTGQLRTVDAVFDVAATFPMEKMRTGVIRQGPPFDVEEFVKQIGGRK
jgi:hypothetical protein